MVTVANFSWKFHLFFIKIPPKPDTEVVAFLWFSGLGYTVVTVDIHVSVNIWEKFITSWRNNKSQSTVPAKYIRRSDFGTESDCV